jgi:hypothetical protein
VVPGVVGKYDRGVVEAHVNEEEAYLVAGAFYNQMVLAICHMEVVTFYPLEEDVHGQMVEVTVDLVVASLVHVCQEEVI